jgi:hypothetical protein
MACYPQYRLTLSEQEIGRIHGMRWDIEVFFKTAKSRLKLEKEFKSYLYDALISHTAIVFADLSFYRLNLSAIIIQATVKRYPS